MSLSCTINEILSLISQYLKRSRDFEHIHFGIMYYARSSTPVHQSSHFEMPSVTDTKDVIGARFKKGVVT